MSDTQKDKNYTYTKPQPIYPILELRQYTHKPGRRDDLIALFETHFIEGQEKYNMQIPGHFRRLNHPDQYVWFRAFPDMAARRASLQGFYSGPIWQEHRTAANDTLLDSDNVLLLTPARPDSSLHIDPAQRPTQDATDSPGGLFITTIYYLSSPATTEFINLFATRIAPILTAAGATLQGYYVTEPAENTFPQLPVRTGEHVFLWIASFASEQAYTAYQDALNSNPEWHTNLQPALQAHFARPQEVLELTPARRSLLRHT